MQRLLEILGSDGADALRLREGIPVTLERTDGSSQSITKQPLTMAHWRAMVGELVAPVTLAAMDAGESGAGDSAASTFVLAGIGYCVSLQRDGGTPAASVRLLNRSGAGRAVDGPVSSIELAESAPIALPPAASLAASAAAAPTPVASSGVVVSPDEPWRREVDPAAHAAIDALLRIQVERGGSDLHLRSGIRPIVRAGGDIIQIDEHEPLDAESLGRMLHAIMPERNVREFHQLNDTDFAYEIKGAGRFRANVLCDSHGPAAVFRSIPSKIVTAEELGLSPELQALCNLTKGLVLVTGPTGSGKSTTLCALVDLVNRTRRDHIITIEDPIEFVHGSKSCLVTQRQVGVHTTSFKHALRAALREDPDVVLVGELRDLETAGMAIETAETGHLVFATMHTSTAASTIDRIIDQFPADRHEQIRVMLSESLKGVIAQTLCRKIGGGRVAAMEILLATPAVSNLIRESKTFQIPSAMQTSRKVGMVTLNDALLDLVERKLVEPKEAYLRAIDKTGVASALKARGFDVSFLEPEPAGGSGVSGIGRPEPSPSSGAGAKPVLARPGLGLRR